MEDQIKVYVIEYIYICLKHNIIITKYDSYISTGDNPAANNCPLRGGKYSDFEGGVRVVSFVSGGLIPEKRRGISLNGSMHIAGKGNIYFIS